MFGISYVKFKVRWWKETVITKAMKMIQMNWHTNVTPNQNNQIILLSSQLDSIKRSRNATYSQVSRRRETQQPWSSSSWPLSSLAPSVAAWSFLVCPWASCWGEMFTWSMKIALSVAPWSSPTAFPSKSPCSAGVLWAIRSLAVVPSTVRAWFWTPPTAFAGKSKYY